MDLTFIISPLDLRGCDSCRKTCKEIIGKYRPSLGTELIRISFLLKIESLQIFVPSSEGWLLWCLCFFTEDMETQGRHVWPVQKAQPFALLPACLLLYIQVAKGRLALIGHWPLCQDPSQQGSGEGRGQQRAWPCLTCFPATRIPKEGFPNSYWLWPLTCDSTSWVLIPHL